MSYKDEYEVARLYTDGSFQRQLADARRLLGEAATGRDDPRPPALVADQLVAQRQSVDRAARL